MIFYILGPGRIIVPERDVVTWSKWMEKGDRRVANDLVAPGVEVSTVFLGLDHNYFDKGPPILFETMVFDDYEGGEQWRYCTWDEAVAGHKAVVERLRARIAATAAKKEPC